MARCPSCGSPDWQKLSVVWKNGLSNVSTVTTGVGIGHNGLAGGAASTAGVQQSALSQAAAPPVADDKLANFMIGGGLLLLLAAWVFNWWWFAAAVPMLLLGIHLSSSAQQANKPAYERWMRMAMCMRCGSRFAVNEATESIAPEIQSPRAVGFRIAGERYQGDDWQDTQPPAAHAPHPPQGSLSAADKLRELKKLADEGLISVSEHEAKRQDILRGL